MSRRKKTKERSQTLKQEREDNPLEDFDGSLIEFYLMQLLHLIKANLKKVLIGIASITAVAIAIIVVFVYFESEDQKSLLGFEKIIETQVGSSSLSSSILAMEDIQKYEKKFSGSQTKKRASLAKIKYLIEDEKFEEAGKNCESLAETTDLPELKSWFLIRSAFLYERAGKSTLALVAYQKTVKSDSPIEIIVAHARYGEIRMLIKEGQLADAKKTLNQMISIESDRSEIKELQKQALALVLSTSLK